MQPPSVPESRAEDPASREAEALAQLLAPELAAAPKGADWVARYEDFLRASVDWLWEVDRDFALIFATSPMTAALGAPVQLAIGRKLQSLGGWRKEDGTAALPPQPIALRRPFRDAVFAFKAGDGKEIAYLLSGVPVFAQSDHRFAGYRGTARRLPVRPAVSAAATAQPDQGEATAEDSKVLMNALEETLLKHQELSWRLARLEGERSDQRIPMARMAHELRTPLNAIVGYAELLLSGAAGEIGARTGDFLRTMLDASRHMDQLVGRLERQDKESGPTALRPEIVEVNSIIAKAKAITALAARTAQVDLRRVGPMAGGRVMADRLALTQILVNLLANAIKFTPSGGAVGLETLVGPGNQLRLVVWDSGVGIAAEEQEKIFENGYRSSKTAAGHDGHGLGLSIARELARAMDGDLTVASQPAKGSRFTLSLPLAAEPLPSSR
ncbi:MAG: sensor histidine kinase [Kiloniellales bacterium]